MTEMTEIQKVEKAIDNMIKARRNLIAALNAGVPGTPDDPFVEIQKIQERIELLDQVLEHEKKLDIPYYQPSILS